MNDDVEYLYPGSDSVGDVSNHSPFDDCEYENSPVRRPRWTKAEILQGVDPTSYSLARVTAHNEVTRQSTLTGARVVRLMATDILHVYRYEPGVFDVTVNTGGWNTATTRRHLTNALHRELGGVWVVYGLYNSRSAAQWRNQLCRGGHHHPFNNACHMVVRPGSLEFRQIDL